MLTCFAGVPTVGYVFVDVAAREADRSPAALMAFSALASREASRDFSSAACFFTVRKYAAAAPRRPPTAAAPAAETSHFLSILNKYGRT